jgi:protein-tyrosine phosphatase
MSRPQHDAGRSQERAFYLDHGWRSAATTGDAEFIDWPDFGVIDADFARSLAQAIAAELEQGETVEIGCLGGHGRTGTLLAIVIGVAESLSAEDALSEARRRYCLHAVETPAQEQLIAEALAPVEGPAA